MQLKGIYLSTKPNAKEASHLNSPLKFTLPGFSYKLKN